MIGASMSKPHTSGVYAIFSVAYVVPKLYMLIILFTLIVLFLHALEYRTTSSFEDNENKRGPAPCSRDSSTKGGKICR